MGIRDDGFGLRGLGPRVHGYSSDLGPRGVGV